MKKILVTLDRRDPGGLKSGPRVRPIRPEVHIGEAYLAAIRRVGGLPVLIAPGDDAEPLLDLVDGVLITGGDFDIHPSWYGERPTARIDRVEEARTSTEIGLARLCLQRRIPILGICGGMQALAVAAGGTLVQDVPKDPLDHEQPTDPAPPWHAVGLVDPATKWFGTRISVNSTHHQAVKSAGSLIPCGFADDGTIEVIASDAWFALGVQWHPELLGDDRPYRALIDA
jgi:putative glutamine amidotransferase